MHHRMILERLMGCFYCGSRMYVPNVDRKADFLADAGFRPSQRGSARFLRYSRETKEHLVRRADGGRGANGNIVKSCAWCNSNRGLRAPDEHKMWIADLICRGEHPVACPEFLRKKAMESEHMRWVAKQRESRTHQ